MMVYRLRIVFVVCALLTLSWVASASSQPPRVPRLADRQLDKASYVELAQQWKKYIEEHGETADALVNLGMAYDYSEELEAALVAAR